jgi:hypothetical protein
LSRAQEIAMPPSEIERHEAKIAELKIKLKNAKDADAIYYYTLCLKGWEKMLTMLKAANP